MHKRTDTPKGSGPTPTAIDHLTGPSQHTATDTYKASHSSAEEPPGAIPTSVLSRPRLQLSPELPDDSLDAPVGTPLTTSDYESLLKPYTPSFPGGLGQRNLLLALAYVDKV